MIKINSDIVKVAPLYSDNENIHMNVKHTIYNIIHKKTRFVCNNIITTNIHRLLFTSIFYHFESDHHNDKIRRSF